MEHAVDARGGTAASVQIGDTAANETYLASHRGEVRAAAGRQVVQHRDVVPRGDEVLHQVRADEARTPRDQKAHMIPLVIGLVIAPCRNPASASGCVLCQSASYRAAI